jgi:NADP-dependent 3-hydroxy acid dehydrogenase YdfG
MSRGIEGKVVVITGASSGLGEAAARRKLVELAIPAESFARVIAFAIGQPEEVDVNEILFRPTGQEF